MKESNLSFTIDMLDKRKRCTNCFYGMNGRCSLYSCNCKQAVSDHVDIPPRWTSIDEGILTEQAMIQGTRPV